MSPPERVLAERFARGEIDEEEYRRRLGVLREEPPGPAKRGRSP
ncbi:SHOCT domain-containing protein [Streptomyces chiangmaiensis]|uniref:SHOCT domain-containing protein n=1 Tax=Streptomyces chiangmaiensis TaxID=766497 RepID=A0ABU7FTJ3_9ACTN|nr:SHOCT domain-containing protein [Streptomyces chiangmaiensis]MED7827284.1 SHOCT domain-containing protein [Streptomyces chiangmaiensis]